MSSELQNTTQELTCPNCGAPYTLPASGNEVVCAHCGSHFLIPESVRQTPTSFPQAFTDPSPFDTSPLAAQAQVRKWVRWLVLIIVVTTVVPLVCGLGAAACGILAPILALLATR